MNSTLLKTQNTVGVLYLPDNSNSTGIIYASGSPGFGEGYGSSFKSQLADLGYTVFVPDYLGS